MGQLPKYFETLTASNVADVMRSLSVFLLSLHSHDPFWVLPWQLYCNARLVQEFLCSPQQHDHLAPHLCVVSLLRMPNRRSVLRLRSCASSRMIMEYADSRVSLRLSLSSVPSAHDTRQPLQLASLSWAGKTRFICMPAKHFCNQLKRRCGERLEHSFQLSGSQIPCCNSSLQDMIYILSTEKELYFVPSK